MISFILNNVLIETDLPEGSTVLDFIRYHQRLTGTKIGCREGDCGACTVLAGDFENGALRYRSVTSCLMPLGNAAGKHLVTVEGLNGKSLNAVQLALATTNGTQCGFCTLGFVLSLTGFALHPTAKKYDEGIAAIDGNICRCTGYKSIERAVQKISEELSDKPKENTIDWLVKNNFIPEYFLHIPARLQSLQAQLINKNEAPELSKLIVCGGTDLLVQKPLTVKKEAIRFLSKTAALKGISIKDETCFLGASTTVTELLESPNIQNIFPEIKKWGKLISSTPIRNMATLAGNFINASPIGDMTVFFLALDSSIVLSDGAKKQNITLKDFYTGYKQLAKEKEEWIEEIFFTIPDKNTKFNFEKVSKRTHLDIASVNSACQLQMADDATIKKMHLSAGGVAPFPKYLAKVSAYLTGKKLSEEVLEEAVRIMNTEIVPISDARGSENYKRLLLRQLFLGHLLHFFGPLPSIQNYLLHAH